MFKKVLIANRGEIAVRVIRALREMGIASVAVFSEPDRKALHVLLADEAVCIGPAESINSYLNIEAILEAAQRTKAEAIHPGYGFLAENPLFAEACSDSSICFIGPSPEAIEAMGDKVRAKKLLQSAGIPVISGSQEAVADVDSIIELAAQIGFPILIKAAAGGGGKGMRIASTKSELKSAVRQAQSESLSAFGDERLLLEKFILDPRHIEIQVLGDSFGNIVHLGERECSIQRRYQKIVEECPSTFVNKQMRNQLGKAAVAAASLVDYVNAGTVEFLVDQDRNFYFLEMNTRLQVEHPITEITTGIDLVKEQIQIAAGTELSFEQKDININGSAIECRIYAEDFRNNFSPSLGVIKRLRLPEGPWIRNDCGVYEGYYVPIHYDSLIAKLSTWGRNRTEAIHRMRSALSEYAVDGITTTLDFHRLLLHNKFFLKGNITTHFLDKHFTIQRDRDQPATEAELAAILSVAVVESNKSQLTLPTTDTYPPASNPWKLSGRRRALSSGMPNIS